MQDDDNQRAIEHMVELAKLTGAACSSVSDGHVIVMRKDKLQTLLDQEGDVVVIFVKSKPDVLQ